MQTTPFSSQSLSILAVEMNTHKRGNHRNSAASAKEIWNHDKNRQPHQFFRSLVVEVLWEAGVDLRADKSNWSFINAAQISKVFTEMFICWAHYLSVNDCKHLPEKAQQQISREHKTSLCLSHKPMSQHGHIMYKWRWGSPFLLSMTNQATLLQFWRKNVNLKKTKNAVVCCCHVWRVFNSRACYSTVAHQTNFSSFTSNLLWFIYKQSLLAVLYVTKNSHFKCVSNSFPSSSTVGFIMGKKNEKSNLHW